MFARLAQTPCSALPTTRERVAALVCCKRAYLASLGDSTVDPLEVRVIITDRVEAETHPLAQTLTQSSSTESHDTLQSASDCFIYPIDVTIECTGSAVA